MTTKLVTIHALSPVHCGTGQSIGGVDLPIAREKPTSIPLIPGSTLKGVLRAAYPAEGSAAAIHRAAFGSDQGAQREDMQAGSVQLSDANLVFLPVRSVRGTFAWVTSAYMLRRLVRDAREAGLTVPDVPKEPANASTALITPGKRLAVGGAKVVFEDLDFSGSESAPLEALAKVVAGWFFDEEGAKERFVHRVCMVDDDVMSLLLQTSMELVARNRLDPDTRTVAKGALWTEESMPVESLLAGMMIVAPVKDRQGTSRGRDELVGHMKSLVGAGAIQLGGKASVGRGVCRVKVVG
jgi:CRISPR-associated protein Cmr4